MTIASWPLRSMVLTSLKEWLAAGCWTSDQPKTTSQVSADCLPAEWGPVPAGVPHGTKFIMVISTDDGH